MEGINPVPQDKLNHLGVSGVRNVPGTRDKSEKEHLDKPVKTPRREFSGFIILRLAESLPLTGDDCDSLAAAAKDLRIAGLMNLLDEFDLSVSRRLVSSMSPRQVQELELKASKSEFPPLHSLTKYWRLDVREKTDRIDEIVKRLSSLAEVDLAYKEFAASDPLVNPADDPYNADQDYLDAAPTGIDARWAWTQPNGEGAGIGFVDLEQGWFPNHEDFTSKSPSIIFGDNMDGVGTYKGNHGTAVLGEVIADDNTVGVVGGVPSVASVHMTSHFDAGSGTNGHVADAILGALPTMNPGDLLLLEVQKSFLPTETDDADFDAIRLAVAHGIVVVEAAGNGNDDLDAYTDSFGDFILNRGSSDFRDSGAIMVGASESALPHDRWWASNFGSRIDCYAWGENIVTCGYGDLDAGAGDDSTYTDTFGGTSGASPIVSSAAITLQSMHEANTGTRLSPVQMRALLSDPVTGTAQGGGVAGDIGVMPDLRAIITNTLGIVPDVYLRDNVGDTGAIPSTGSISASPDIIVRKAAVANPQAAFGQGSGTENSTTLGYEAEGGQDNFIYVRVRNRGGANANNVTATVYWSEVSTLVTPSTWNLVGTSAPINVPQGNTLVVADPITWAAADIPATGHYCFIGILNHAGDPAPPIPGATDWNGFQNFIHNLNNVTWRNFNVVDLDPDSAEDPAELQFLLAGAPDRRRMFDMEILQQMAKGTRIWLEVPLGLAKQFLEGQRWKYEIDRKNGLVRLLLPAAPRLYMRNMRFGKDMRIKARFIVKGLKETVQEGNSLAIRQLFEKQEVGRVTWQFHNRRKDKLLD